MKISSLSELKIPRGAARPMSVCVVSSEFLGPVRNGGIATATSALVNQLVADGHKVTLLYTLVEYGKPASGDRPWQDWVDALARGDVSLSYIEHGGRYRAWREKSWRVKEFIGRNRFDLVYFNEHHGSGYYALLSKHNGLAPFCEQVHCVITHGAIEWVFDINEQFIQGVSDLEMMGLERRSAELADVVIGPSRYLLNRYEAYGWRLPARTFCQPYPLAIDAKQDMKTSPLAVDELVFFGRLEVRKGLWLFANALDQLGDRLAGKTVTFLGRTIVASAMSSGMHIVERCRKWPCRVKLLTDLDQSEALEYLTQPRRLAVMPSLADNSPCVVYECLAAGVPFLTTGGSGTEELIHPDSLDTATVAPTANALSAALATVLDKGAGLARPRFSSKENLAAWSDWHRYVSAHGNELTAKPASVTLEEAAKGLPDALLVVLDNGLCTLSLLEENLKSHAARFGTRAAFLVLTVRRGELQEFLFDLISRLPGMPPGALCIASPEGMSDARQLMANARHLFLLDAETQVQTPFFALALGRLEREPGIASCIGAVRHAGNTESQIEQLAAGVVPGLTALGDSVSGNVLAVSVEMFRERLLSLEFLDPRSDLFTPTASLSLRLITWGRVRNIPVHFLPIVGGIETREFGRTPGVIPFQTLAECSPELGISPSVHSGGAAWFALSAFGAHLEQPGPGQIPVARFLAMEHPLRLHQTPGEIDPAHMAAAMGRLDLSLQLAVSTGANTERTKMLGETAIHALRLRPPIELTKNLPDGRLKVDSGGNLSGDRTPNVNSKPDTDVPPPESAVHMFFDASKLEIRRKRIRATENLLDSAPGRIAFMDVPLSGHAQLAANFRFPSRKCLDLSIKVLDQATGEAIGTRAAAGAAKQGGEVTLPLHGIYGWATVILQFSGETRAEMEIDSLAIS
jgi:glycosyltransferase involved in cell wall biosynthesis